MDNAENLAALATALRRKRATAERWFIVLRSRMPTRMLVDMGASTKRIPRVVSAAPDRDYSR